MLYRRLCPEDTDLPVRVLSTESMEPRSRAVWSYWTAPPAFLIGWFDTSITIYTSLQHTEEQKTRVQESRDVEKTNQPIRSTGGPRLHRLSGDHHHTEWYKWQRFGQASLFCHMPTIYICCGGLTPPERPPPTSCNCGGSNPASSNAALHTTNNSGGTLLQPSVPASTTASCRCSNHG